MTLCESCDCYPCAYGGDRKEPHCDAGCSSYYGGERRHLKTCAFYPESFSQMYDSLVAERCRLTARVAELEATLRAMPDENDAYNIITARGVRSLRGAAFVVAARIDEIARAALEATHEEQ